MVREQHRAAEGSDARGGGRDVQILNQDEPAVRDASIPNPVVRGLLGLCLFEAAFYVAYRYGMTFSHATASPFWFPDSVLLCALLLTRPRHWWLFVLAPLPIRLLVEVPADSSLWFLLSTFAIDSAKGVLAATILRRFIAYPFHFASLRQLALYGASAVLLIPALGAFAGAAARSALGYDYWSSWEQWFLGNSLAHLVVTPIVFYWILGVRWRLPVHEPRRWAEAALLVCGLLVTGYLAFEWPTEAGKFAEPRFYAPVPFLVWAAIRFGMRGATGAVAIIACYAIVAALQERGPFAGQSAADTGLALQHFLLLRAAPLYVVAVLIEQARDMERSLRESELRFRDLADSAPIMIWMSGVDKLCSYVSSGWLAFTGRTVQQEIGDGWASSVHPADRQHCLETYTTAFDQRRPFEVEYRLRRHDGAYRWIIDRGVPRHARHGAFIGYVGTALDVTDLRTAQQTQRSLEHASRLAVVGELTAMVVHEVKQPLSAILMNTEAAELLLKSDSPPLDQVREILADIREDDERADRAIQRMRALLSRREFRMQMLDLNECIADGLKLVVGDLQQRGVRLETDLAPDLPAVAGDPVYLQQVLLNLVVNGMDAMQAEPQPRLIVRTVACRDEGVEVSVCDCGRGIPTERFEDMFDSFVSTKKEGMGLGLSIARSIMEGHRGRIWAENNLTRGATFHFLVPFTGEATQAADADTSSPSALPFVLAQ